MMGLGWLSQRPNSSASYVFVFHISWSNHLKDRKVSCFQDVSSIIYFVLLGLPRFYLFWDFHSQSMGLSEHRLPWYFGTHQFHNFKHTHTYIYIYIIYIYIYTDVCIYITCTGWASRCTPSHRARKTLGGSWDSAPDAATAPGRSWVLGMGMRCVKPGEILGEG